MFPVKGVNLINFITEKHYGVNKLNVLFLVGSVYVWGEGNGGGESSVKLERDFWIFSLDLSLPVWSRFPTREKTDRI